MPIAQADSRSARGRSIKVLGRQVNPLKLGLCSAFATALCLLALFSSQAHIRDAAAEHGWQGTDDAKLQVPDLRFGYSADELTTLFEAWGPVGRQWYLVTEAIDVFAYIPSYALALTVLLTVLGAVAGRKTGLTVLRMAHLWPLILGVVDWVEDALQVLLVNSYVDEGQALPGWWTAVVPAASAVNQFKWLMVRGGMLFMVLLVAAAAAPRLLPRQPPKPATKTR